MQQVARQLNQESKEEYNKQTVTLKKVEPTPNPYLRSRAIIFSLAFLWGICMMVGAITASVQAANAQRQYQLVKTKLANVNQNNTRKQQAISEMTSRAQLDKVAKEAGMSIDNQSIRNVTK